LELFEDEAPLPDRMDVYLSEVILPTCSLCKHPTVGHFQLVFSWLCPKFQMVINRLPSFISVRCYDIHTIMGYQDLDGKIHLCFLVFSLCYAGYQLPHIIEQFTDNSQEQIRILWQKLRSYGLRHSSISDRQVPRTTASILLESTFPASNKHKPRVSIRVVSFINRNNSSDPRIFKHYTSAEQKSICLIDHRMKWRNLHSTPADGSI